MTAEQRRQVEELRDQLLEGLVSSTEAASKAADIIRPPKLESTPETKIWGRYDEEVRGKTIIMLDELLIFGGA